MKQPQLKKPSSGFQGTLEMSQLLHVAPSSDENAWNVSISLLLGSLRLSNQIACKFPASSTAIHGKNWSFGAAAPPAVLMVFASDHVVPPSRDCWNEMSAPDVCRSTLFW